MKKLTIKEADDYVATKTDLEIKGGRLHISITFYEREHKNEDWFESGGSSFSLPLGKIRDLLSPSGKKGKVK